MPLRRELGRTDSHTETNGSNTQQQDQDETLDMVIVGAGFAGIWLLHELRKRGFSAKIVEVSLPFQIPAN